MSCDSKQTPLPLAFGVHRGPADAPRKLVLACLQHDAPMAMALAVAMRANGRKLAYVAACIDRHESYVSLLRSGKRHIPDALIAPLCAASGSNLLRQVHDVAVALSPENPIEQLARQLRSAA